VLAVLALTKKPAVETEGHPALTSVPALTLPQEKLLAVVAEVLRVTALPGATAVTVVVFVAEPAVTPTAAKDVWQLLIAVARFPASVVVFELVRKVPAVELEQLLGPSIVPPLGFNVITLLVLVKVMLPVVVFFTVVTAPETVAVAPELPPFWKQEEVAHSLKTPSIAARRFWAEWLAVLPVSTLAPPPLRLVTNVYCVPSMVTMSPLVATALNVTVPVLPVVGVRVNVFEPL
jgi:hypothetical protein